MSTLHTPLRAEPHTGAPYSASVYDANGRIIIASMDKETAAAIVEAHRKAELCDGVIKELGLSPDITDAPCDSLPHYVRDLVQNSNRAFEGWAAEKERNTALSVELRQWQDSLAKLRREKINVETTLMGARDEIQQLKAALAQLERPA